MATTASCLRLTLQAEESDMAGEADVRAYKIIDADTHVIEPPDLWTSRMSKAKWGDMIPHVRFESAPTSYKSAGEGLVEPPADTWFVGSTPLMKAAAPAMAGWHEHVPSHPMTLAEADPHNLDPTLRLQKMDEYGVHAAVLYPNIGIFVSAEYLGLSVDPSYALECVQAYNDYIAEEWIAVARDRYVGMATLPFWDLDATEREIQRCTAMGHKGIIFSTQPENYGLPSLDDRHWDRLWSIAQEAEVAVNFHIGGGKLPPTGHPDNGVAANYAWGSVLLYPSNMRTITGLIFGGICHRFPRLNFVSVESGIGWIPAVVEAMEWQWRNAGVHKEHPDYDLTPLEYFQRQIYGCFWFEEASALAAIDQLGSKNFLYETDFPHPTSMSPGPASVARVPVDYVVDTLGHLPAPTLADLLHNNAARIYHLDEV
jgi:predicted TIM-barrel fold metal-dependent hydrolase